MPETVRPARDSNVEETRDDLSEEVAEPATTYASAVPPAFRSPAARRAALRRDLVEQIWPRIPKRLLGRGVSKEEREEILGYGGASGIGREPGGAVSDAATRGSAGGDRAKGGDP
jgi:antitoxin VapB